MTRKEKLTTAQRRRLLRRACSDQGPAEYSIKDWAVGAQNAAKNMLATARDIESKANRLLHGAQVAKRPGHDFNRIRNALAANIQDASDALWQARHAVQFPSAPSAPTPSPYEKLSQTPDHIVWAVLAAYENSCVTRAGKYPLPDTRSHQYRLHIPVKQLELTLTGRNGNTRTVKMPPLRIIFCLNERMFPVDYPRVYATSESSDRNGYPHPHINRDGSICLGDATRAMGHAYDQNDMLAMTDVVMGVLRNYNRESPFISLAAWATDVCVSCENEERVAEHRCEFCNTVVCDVCTTMTFKQAGRYKVDKYDNWAQYEEEMVAICRNCSFTCATCDTGVVREDVSECSECGSIMCYDCGEYGGEYCGPCGGEVGPRVEYIEAAEATMEPLIRQFQIRHLYQCIEAVESHWAETQYGNEPTWPDLGVRFADESPYVFRVRMRRTSRESPYAAGFNFDEMAVITANTLDEGIILKSDGSGDWRYAPLAKRPRESWRQFAGRIKYACLLRARLDISRYRQHQEQPKGFLPEEPKEEPKDAETHAIF